jgi:putative sterol carrier protein
VKIFSTAWQKAWETALQSSAEYQNAARTWEGALILTVGDVVRLYLDLHHGDCREIRDATREDECRFELTAPREIWLDLLKNGKDPLYLVMRGKLKLVQGSKAQLLPYSKAAKLMLAAAQDLDGVDYE